MQYYKNQQIQVDFLKKVLDINPSSRILDIGSGSGYHIQQLQQVTPAVFGVDIKKPDCKVDNFIQGSVFSIDLPMDLDGVYLLAPFFGKDWDRYDELFAKLSVSVKSGGKIVLDVFNFNYYPIGGGFKDFRVLKKKIILSDFVRESQAMVCNRLIKFDDWSEIKNSIKWKVFSMTELDALLLKYGFKSLQSFYDYNVHDVVNDSQVLTKQKRSMLLAKL